ncbi:citrate lyase holo-[acyl-carrier protein] synthase [Lactobacillus sp. XV13L]|nr:citrate lyase holo-[acyl-carrier protein] synthase [Lactobacillus sp. XV13L]
MVKSIFTEGKRVGIDAVLADKDERVRKQRQLFQTFPGAVLLDVKLNVPGPVKNNRFIGRLFAAGAADLEGMLKKGGMAFDVAESWDRPTGCEKFYVLKENSRRVKELAMALEDSTVWGRLFDADVLVQKNKQAISRKELNLPLRKCFLCERAAKDCARSRRHSVAQLQDYISALYAQNFK